MGNPKEKISHILSLLNIKKLLYSKTKTFRLSHGEQAKINLCKSLLNDPDILLLDEISSALDHTTRALLYQILLKMKKRGKTTLLASHTEDEALVLYDRILVLCKGRLVYNGKMISPKKLYTFYE